MDCQKAQELLASALDAAIPEAELAEARAHCAGCEACAAFLCVTERLGALPAPVAPSALVERLIAIGAEEAASVRAATQGASAPDADEPAGAPEAPVRSAAKWWAPRLSAYAAAAAVLLVALVATGIGLGGLLGGREAATQSTDSLRTDTAGSSLSGAVPPSSAESAKDATAAYGDVAAAPPYVVIDGLVYAPTGPRTVDASSLVTTTPAYTALDTGVDPVALDAYRVTSEPGHAVVRDSSGTLLGFSAVTRRFGGKDYALEAGAPVTAYGLWPVLPARFAIPTGADGSPTFSFFGKDDLGVRIYVPAGTQPSQGFAVAPDTAPDDPAAGNPNWTWWRPL